MTTNIKTLRLVLPATEDREELDLTERIVGAEGLGGFDGLMASYDERLTRPWSIEDAPSLGNPYPDGATISDQLGYNLAVELAAYIEEHEGPMMRVEGFEPDGFVVVAVEDGGIDVTFVAYDDRDRIRLEALITAFGLELTVELLDEEDAPRQDPDEIVSVTGVIHRANGVGTPFEITNTGQTQWGATGTVLGQSVDILTAMTEAAREHLPKE